MIVLRIKSLELDNDVDHIATDWQVSDTMNFANIICESIEDLVFKRSKLFPNQLEPGRKYYARARALLTTGYTEWGNLDVFTVDNNIQLTDNEDLPSNISIPLIKTVNDKGDEDPQHHDVTAFRILISGFSVVGNATLDGVTYWIEDIFGNIVWCDEYDLINKAHKDVHDVILKENSIYRVKAVFHSTSGDTSQVATRTIHTAGGQDIDFITYIDDLDPASNTTLEIAPIAPFKEVEWEILAYVDNYVQPLWKSKTKSFYTVLKAGTLNPNSNYILKIGTDISNGYKFIPFKTKV